jgi:pectate lyase-like protein
MTVMSAIFREARMRSTLFVLVAIIAVATEARAQSPTPLKVFDVVEYGATGASCAGDTAAIQDAIEAARLAGGGTVYFPPGAYCLSDSLRGYSNVTLRGASLGVLNGGSASRLQIGPGFGANKAMIRMNNPAIVNSGFQVEDLSLEAYSGEDGIVGIDFSGVAFGAIRGVGIIGSLYGDPRRVQSAGSIGFLFSDTNASLCVSNLVERTSVAYLETGYRFNSSQGGTRHNTLTSFWTSDTMNGIWTSAPQWQGQSLSLRDGYMSTILGVAGKKAFKHTSGYAILQAIGIEYEFFDAPNDLRIANGGLTSLGSSEVVLSGEVTASGFTPLVSAADGYNCGATSACPCRPGTYPPPYSHSFWASIPGGTTLSAGENAFTFYTWYAQNNPNPIQDLYFTFHPTYTGGIGQPFQFSGTNSVTVPYGYSFQTYNVRLYVQEAVQLTSDLIFFLEANMTSPTSTPGVCLYPPSLP